MSEHSKLGEEWFSPALLDKKDEASVATKKVKKESKARVDVENDGDRVKVRVKVQDITIEANSPEELREKLAGVFGPLRNAMRAAFAADDDDADQG